MSALHFTAQGVVDAPDTVQIRIGAAFEGRVGFGAPQPSRVMGVAEVIENIDHFRHPEPRTHPVSRLVLSGVPDDWALEGVVEHSVRVGMDRIVAHLRPGVDRAHPQLSVAVAVRSVADVEAMRRARCLPWVTIPLEAGVLPQLGSILDRIADSAYVGVTLVWPYPHHEGPPPPSVEEIGPCLRAVGEQLERLRWGVKGLPRCTLRAVEASLSLEGRIRRTANRYYVDADHQCGSALRLRPDMLSLAKRDACRFCKVDQHCDGVAGKWLRAGLTGELAPVQDVVCP